MNEINIFIQTPFDARPYHVGGYLINENIQIDAEFSGEINKKLIVKENPFIFANHWSECVSNNYVIISYYREYLGENFFDSINYLLDDLSKKLNIIFYLIPINPFYKMCNFALKRQIFH